MKQTLNIFYFLLIILVAISCKSNLPDDNNTETEVVDSTSTDNNHDNEVPIDSTTIADSTTVVVIDSVIVVTPDSIVDTPDSIVVIPDSIITVFNVKDTVLLNFQYGEDGTSPDWTNLYTIWIESGNYLQHLFVCNKLIKGGLTGTALPYWKFNKYPHAIKSEVDAVTSATISNKDFTITAVLKDSTIKNFTIYFETDRSFDPNDWFTDQPALLFAAQVNLSDPISTYELVPVGWTPNENTENIVDNTPKGKLQSEMRYITNLKGGTLFGTTDKRGATKMVRKITLTIK